MNALRLRHLLLLRLRQQLPRLVRACQKASLGDAQAVFASRAEARSSPPGLIAALHCGASGASAASC